MRLFVISWGKELKQKSYVQAVVVRQLPVLFVVFGEKKYVKYGF